MLQDVKDALRVNGDDLNNEILDLIEAAKADLILSGVNKDKVIKLDKGFFVKEEGTTWESISLMYDIPLSQLLEMNDMVDGSSEIKTGDKIFIERSDPLIKRAITLYCKAKFGYDEVNMAERFQQSYISLKHHLTLSAEYTGGD